MFVVILDLFLCSSS